MRGIIGFEYIRMASPLEVRDWKFETAAEEMCGQIREPVVLGFYAKALRKSGTICIPHWFAVLIVGGIAAAPWIRRFRRFSLRTLLVAMTLVAVVLAIVVWTFER